MVSDVDSEEGCMYVYTGSRGIWEPAFSPHFSMNLKLLLKNLFKKKKLKVFVYQLVCKEASIHLSYSLVYTR